MKPEITLVTLGVEDVDESVRFYRDGLGFPMQERGEDDVAFFTLEGTCFSLYPKGLLAEDAAVPDDGIGFSGITLAHNVPERNDVDAVLEEAEASGGRIVKPARDAF